MQHEKPHTAKHALLEAIDHRIVNAGMGGVPPPGQHIGPAQDLIGQPVLWLILSSNVDRDGITQQFGETSGDCTVHAAGVALSHASLVAFGSFMKVLAPYGDADRWSHVCLVCPKPPGRRGPGRSGTQVELGEL